MGERPRYNPGSPSVLSICCNPETITLPNKERNITQQTKQEKIYDNTEAGHKIKGRPYVRFYNMTSVLSEYPTFVYQDTLLIMATQQ